jgi:MFS transporter, Spinster family, sphingosine-1-phosphate transporter
VTAFAGPAADPQDRPPLREVVAGAGWYPLVILTVLNVVDELDRAVFAPEIQRYFGISDTTVGLIVGIQVSLAIVAAVPLGYLAMKVDRARFLRRSAAAWSFFSTVTALAVTVPAFLLTRFGVGIGRAAVEPVGKAMLADTYPPSGWNRVFAVHNAANPVGGIIGPLLAGLIGVFVAGDGAWRVAFPLLTIPTLLALWGARRFREPENEMAKGFLRATTSATGAPPGESFRSSVAELLRIPTFRRVLVGIGVLGFALLGLLPFVSLLFEREFGVSEAGRGVIFGILGVANLIGTLVGGPVGERAFATSPRRSTELVGAGVAVFAVIAGVAVFLPWVSMVVALLFVATIVVSLAFAPSAALLSAITRPRLRPLMFSLLGLCVALFGGVLGAVIVGTVADAANLRVGLATMLPFGIAGGALLASAGRTIDGDIAAAGVADLPLRRG